LLTSKRADELLESAYDRQEIFLSQADPLVVMNALVYCPLFHLGLVEPFPEFVVASGDLGHFFFLVPRLRRLLGPSKEIVPRMDDRWQELSQFVLRIAVKLNM
jgi:hypothetical protein